jgi:lipoprotein-anchoring transpeptidase ErfK/SrfK
MHEGERTMKTAAMTGRLRIALCGTVLFLATAALPMRADSGQARAGSVDWLKPTGGPYPALRQGERLWINVSLSRQKVDIMKGERSIYTMVASSGLDDPPDDRTPEGTFYVQRERGLSFYSPKAKEGGRYWVSWLHHGEYLFHSVPIDKKGNIIAEEARKLGSKASHGCVRLSLPDAKWIYENIGFGTKVVIGP